MLPEEEKRIMVDDAIKIRYRRIFTEQKPVLPLDAVEVVVVNAQLLHRSRSIEPYHEVPPPVKLNPEMR